MAKNVWKKDALSLNPGGHVFIGLNPGQGGWFYTDELREFFLRRGAKIERERVFFPDILGHR